MKIAITDSDLFNYGGGQTHAIRVINLLNKHYDIYCFPDPKYAKYKLSDIEDKIQYLEKDNIKIVDSFYDIIGKNYSYNKIINIYSKNKMDFILSFDLDYNNFFNYSLTLELSKRNNKKFGITLQGMGDFNIHLLPYVYATLKLTKNYHILIYRLNNYISRHIMMNKLLKSKNLMFIAMVNNNYNINVNIKFKNVHILNPSNGISNTLENIKNNINLINLKRENKIIYFARLTYGKGLFDIIYIFKNIIKRFDTKLVIAGKFIYDYEKNQFFKLINKYNLNDKIVYKGFLSNDELYKEIYTSKLMVYPSHSDSFSIALAQGISLNTPVIAYNIAGLQIYKNFKSVKLISEFDYGAMADEALKILNNNDNIVDESINEFIHKYTWENVASQYREMIDKYATCEYPGR